MTESRKNFLWKIGLSSFLILIVIIVYTGISMFFDIPFNDKKMWATNLLSILSMLLGYSISNLKKPTDIIAHFENQSIGQLNLLAREALQIAHTKELRESEQQKKFEQEIDDKHKKIKENIRRINDSRSA